MGTGSNLSTPEANKCMSTFEHKKLLLRGSLGGRPRSGSLASNKHELMRKKEVANENFTLIRKIGEVKTRDSLHHFSDRSNSARITPSSKAFMDKQRFNIEKENLRLYLQIVDSKPSVKQTPDLLE